MRIKTLYLFSIFLFLWISIAACQSSQPTAPPAPPEPSALPMPPPSMPPQAGPQPPPVGSPLLHEVYGATSNDGMTFTELPGPFFKEASVPDVVEITVDSSKVAPKGTLALYFLDFSRTQRGDSADVTMVTSMDGRFWSPKRQVVFNGLQRPNVVADPSVVELPDGKLRLYFYYPSPPGAANNEPEHEFLSAISEDGINFQVEPGTRLRGLGLTDPEVVKVGDEWLMIYLANDGPHLARSRDGLEWKPDQEFNVPGGSVLMPDGKIRVFGLREKGVWGALYDVNPLDLGKGGMPPASQVGTIGDAPCIRRMDGSYYMVRKTEL